jgi:hypothetical protein
MNIAIFQGLWPVILLYCYGLWWILPFFKDYDERFFSTIS